MNVVMAADFRTLEARPTSDSLIKPGELVDIVEMTPLTLADRRIYNLLIEHAWETIDKPVEHRITKKALRGSHNVNDRVGDTIERLMAAIVKIKVKHNDREEVERVQLLGGNTEQLHADGVVRYEFPAKLRRIIKNSTIFARLQKEVMFALSSKYSLALYEMVQKRGNLNRNSEEFSLQDLRGFLGVPKSKLTTWSNFNNRALTPAIKEVSAISDYIIEATLLRTGRAVTRVLLTWWPKDAEGVQQVAAELDHSKVGRRARIEGTVELVQPQERIPPLKTETYEEARQRYHGWDIYQLEHAWLDWARDRPLPIDADKAFLGFCDEHVKRNQLV